MLMDKYPVYFEVKLYIEGEGEVCEGGILYADNYEEAMREIEHVYKDDLVSVFIQLLETYSLCLPLEKAKAIRGLIE